MRIQKSVIITLIAAVTVMVPWVVPSSAAVWPQDKVAPEPSNEDQDADQDDDSPAAQFKALEGEYTKAMQAFMAAYSKAKPEERQKLFEEKYPQPEDFAERFMEFAEQHPDAPEAVDALVWVVNRVRTGDMPMKALHQLLSKHMDDPKLKDVAMSLAYSMPSAKVEQALRTMAEKSSNDEVRGMATYALASFLARNQSTADYVKENPEMAAQLDAEVVDYLSRYELNEDKVKALYQKVIEEFGEIPMRDKTLGEYADRALFEMENLTVGKIAPDIEGEDLDGEPFKLSDYRGKIVMLDFWGDW